jgi:hypothetical protein
MAKTGQPFRSFDDRSFTLNIISEKQAEDARALLKLSTFTPNIISEKAGRRRVSNPVSSFDASLARTYKRKTL